MARASRLEAELKAERPDLEVALVESSGGVFEVTADGVLIFSKRAAGRHARPGEVIENLRERT